ncbi:MAG: hypothetical protein WCW44_03385 [archaeon]
MVDTKKASARKQMEQNASDANLERAQAAERYWLKGNKTSMEQNIIDAGRVGAKPKVFVEKEATKEKK